MLGLDGYFSVVAGWMVAEVWWLVWMVAVVWWLVWMVAVVWWLAGWLL